MTTYLNTDEEDIPPGTRRASLTFDQQVEVILKEVSAFKMVPHLLWGLWSIKNFIDSKHLFGYWVSTALKCISVVLIYRHTNITKYKHSKHNGLSLTTRLLLGICCREN